MNKSKLSLLLALPVSLSSSFAMADIDTAAIGTAITAAKDTGLSVGGMVAVAVAGMVVIGLVISMVKKL